MGPGTPLLSQCLRISSWAARRISWSSANTRARRCSMVSAPGAGWAAAAGAGLGTAFRGAGTTGALGSVGAGAALGAAVFGAEVAAGAAEAGLGVGAATETGAGWEGISVFAKAADSARWTGASWAAGLGWACTCTGAAAIGAGLGATGADRTGAEVAAGATVAVGGGTAVSWPSLGIDLRYKNPTTTTRLHRASLVNQPRPDVTALDMVALPFNR